MPKGPKGEKRPADVIGAAVKVMQIATGEVEEELDEDGKNKAAVELGRKGGAARAKKLTKKRRSRVRTPHPASQHLLQIIPAAPITSTHERRRPNGQGPASRCRGGR